MNDNKLTPAEQSALEYRCRLLASFLASETWKLMDIMFEHNENAAYNAAMNAKDGFEMSRHMGSHKAIRDLRSWPARELKFCTERLAAAR